MLDGVLVPRRKAEVSSTGFAAQVGSVFTLEHQETSHRRFEVPVSKWLLPSSWKYLAGNLVVASTYVRAQSPHQ